MEIKASDVKSLREKTGAGMMECKKALQECNGNAKEAEKYLKEKGLAAVEKRADRATSEGIIVIKNNESKAVMVEVTCETDFVAKNTDFIDVANKITDIAFEKNYSKVEKELSDLMLDLATRVRENMSLARLALIPADSNEYIAKYIHSDKKTGVVLVLKSDKPEIFKNKDIQDFAYDCCLHSAAFTPLFVRKEDVDEEYLKEQTEIFTAHAAELDKPEHVKAGIVQGKVKKHLADICFLEQPFVKDDKLSVAKKMEEVGKAAGGSLELSKLVMYQLGRK